MIQNLTKKQTGFTLVELLVVIAIIGLLSTIVVVSFGPVRDRARDTAIRANMASMRLAAEVHWGNNNTYVGADARTDFIAARDAATAAGGGAGAHHFNATAFCIRHTLPGGGNWCIDSEGRAGNFPACNTANSPFRCGAT